MKRFNLTLATIFVLVASAFSHAQESLPNLVRRIKPSVVLVVLYDANGKKIGTGSGFCVAPGQVITNYHVIKIASRVEVHSATGDVYPVSDFSTTNEQDDLAVLKIAANSTQLPPLPVARTLPEEGERVIVIGSPRGLEGSVSDGIVSSVRTLPTGKILQITAPISPGSSGSPVVNMRGEVVGVAVGANESGQNLNFAISADRIAALEPSAVTYAPLPKTAKANNSASRARAEKLYKQASKLNRKGTYVQSLVYMKQAVAEDPDFAFAWFELGGINKSLENYEDAVAAYERALQIGFPEDDDGFMSNLAHTFAGYIYMERLKKPEKAVEHYRKASKLKPDKAAAFYHLGVGLLHTKQYTDAVDALLQCTRLEPDHYDAYLRLGYAYLLSGQYAQAATAFRQEIRLNPNNASAHYGIGVSYFYLGDKKSALEEYEILRRLDPKQAKQLLEAFVDR